MSCLNCPGVAINANTRYLRSFPNSYHDMTRRTVAATMHSVLVKVDRGGGMAAMAALAVAVG